MMKQIYELLKLTLLKMKLLDIRCIFIILSSLLVAGRAEIYLVTIDGEPVISYTGGVDGFEATSVESDEKIDTTSELVTSYARHLENKHDMLLGMLFERGTYQKLYSYSHLINGFAVHVSPEQAETLRRAPGVKSVERDWKVKRLTIHTPQFLGLPTEVWPTGGGFDRAGEDIVIGFVDSGIYPLHPSFATHNTEPYGPVPRYRGKCEIDPDTRKDFCNGKIIGAQHFARAATAAGAFNPSIDFASPLDGDGHGSHTAAIAAGNNGIPVRMHGHEFGKASGMAPRARIAVYKALYRLFGGYVADVVAAIDQAVHDGVDILSLSVGPNSPPATTKTTYLNPFDATLLGAVKAGVFVAQAAGNGGPYPRTLVSYSPWIASVAAAVDDRRYKNHLILGNGKILAGIGLSPSTHPNQTYTLVAANDVLLDSSVMKYSPTDCQKPEVLNKKLVEGNILLCGYSFNFVVGTASIKKVSETAKALGAVGFALCVENVSPGTKFDPVPVAIPGILIADVSDTKELIDYYNISTPRDWTGRVKSFKGSGRIGDGLVPILHKSAPQVALFSSRGPNIKDFSFQEADLLKPDILAPGSLIWAAWSPNGTDEPNYMGDGFAMISGTSMAAPHIAGIAALIKQKHPQWSPAAIKSSLMTTSSTLDRAGRPLLAQQNSETEAFKLVTATPFDYGSGHVNPRAALDPGLIFDAGYQDYLGFLCTTPGIDVHEIKNYTNTPCNTSMDHPSNFNTPSITLSHLVGTRTVTRTVTNVAEEETYVVTARMAPAIAIEVNPPAMTIKPGASRKFSVTLTVRSVTGTYSFGEILMKGSRGHKPRLLLLLLLVGSARKSSTFGYGGEALGERSQVERRKIGVQEGAGKLKVDLTWLKQRVRVQGFGRRRKKVKRRIE
ncbi:subtilisin-like protease SBT2.5 [Senna tora]|uniref:Subtilisin-like protease SBT2.5 n=1 Tax=Senna tora TaxID=362788 RepID=A0A834W5K4_9FABA|nr:subtilisin-like protease SBT2.5 [Senna tora]